MLGLADWRVSVEWKLFEKSFDGVWDGENAGKAVCGGWA